MPADSMVRSGRLKVSVSTMPMRMTTRRSVTVYTAVRAVSQASVHTPPKARALRPAGHTRASSTSAPSAPSAMTLAA